MILFVFHVWKLEDIRAIQRLPFVVSHTFPWFSFTECENRVIPSIHNSPMSRRHFPDFPPSSGRCFVGKCKANLPLSSVATSGATTPSAQVLCQFGSRTSFVNMNIEFLFDQMRMILPQACQVITLYSMDRPRSVSGGTPRTQGHTFFPSLAEPMTLNLERWSLFLINRVGRLSKSKT